MAIPASAAPRSDFDEPNLAAEAKFFSERMGWPIRIEAAHERLVVATGEALDAFRVPRTLAEHVARNLATSLLIGPVSKDGGDRWWTFITEPCRRPEKELPQELRAARVYAVPSGGHLVVPPIATRASWWQQPQPGQPLPPWAAVVATARQVVAGSSATVVPLRRKARPSRPRTGSGT